jgi:hypothetical protein
MRPFEDDRLAMVVDEAHSVPCDIPRGKSGGGRAPGWALTPAPAAGAIKSAVIK